MAFPKGKPNPNAGRKPGIQNAINRQLKETILEALEAAHPDGAIGYLVDQAQTNPNAFMQLVGKVLPLQIANPPGETFKTEADDLTSKILAALPQERLEELLVETTPEPTAEPQNYH